MNPLATCFTSEGIYIFFSFAGNSLLSTVFTLIITVQFLGLGLDIIFFIWHEHLRIIGILSGSFFLGILHFNTVFHLAAYMGITLTRLNSLRAENRVYILFKLIYHLYIDVHCKNGEANGDLYTHVNFSIYEHRLLIINKQYRKVLVSSSRTPDRTQNAPNHMKTTCLSRTRKKQTRSGWVKARRCINFSNSLQWMVLLIL